MGRRKQDLKPGNLVLGLGDGIDLKMRSGIVIAVEGGELRKNHFGCEHRLLILWSGERVQLLNECDCSIMLMSDIMLDG